MSTTFSIEFRLPSIIRVSSCMPVYAHILVSVLTTLLLWFLITLATAKPPVREISSRHAHVHSLTSTTFTLVDPISREIIDVGNHQKKEETLSEGQDEGKYVTFTNPFADVSSPVRLSRSPSLALHPFARRLSMPGRRPSFSDNPHSHPFYPAHTPLRQHATVYRHGSLADDEDSYFPSPHVPSGRVRLIPDVKAEQDVQCTPLMTEPEPLLNTQSVAAPLPKKTTKVKRVTKKVAALFSPRRGV